MEGMNWIPLGSEPITEKTLAIGPPSAATMAEGADAQAPAEVPGESTGAPAVTALAPAAAPVKKRKVYLLEAETTKQIAQFEFEAPALPKVIVWFHSVFVQEGSTSLYRKSTAAFVGWGEEPAKS